MDGVSASVGGAATDLAASGVSDQVQVSVLRKSLDTAANEVLPLLKGIGENVDLRA